MDEILKPKINLKEQPTITCESCGCLFFKEVTMLKKVSKILTGGSEDTIVPFPTYACNECGNINEDLKLFDN